MAQDDWDGFGVVAIEERKLQTSPPCCFAKRFRPGLHIMCLKSLVFSKFAFGRQPGELKFKAPFHKRFICSGVGLLTDEG
jgi:hypothetical protein